MRTKLTLADLRLRLSVRLAVAPRHLFKQLWEPRSRPHERDATREELVSFITLGWDSMDIDATGPEMATGHVPVVQGPADDAASAHEDDWRSARS